MAAGSVAMKGNVRRASNRGNVVVSDGRKQPFSRVMRDLLIERDITTGMGNPNWMAFVEGMPGVHYETLRKAISGERAPNVALMEACASALGVDPMVFLEYEAAQTMRQFDPREVGPEVAAENLALWAAARSKRRR